MNEADVTKFVNNARKTLTDAQLLCSSANLRIVDIKKKIVILAVEYFKTQFSNSWLETARKVSLHYFKGRHWDKANPETMESSCLSGLS